MIIKYEIIIQFEMVVVKSFTVSCRAVAEKKLLLGD
jgi:hypothetical protein